MDADIADVDLSIKKNKRGLKIYHKQIKQGSNAGFVVVVT